MPDVLAALGTVVETAKRLREISQKIKDAETKNLIADLNLNLADLKIQVADLQDENRRLRGELAAARVVADQRSRLKRQGNFYYLSNPAVGEIPGPYCTGCFDSRERLVLVSELGSVFAALGSHQCPVCQSVYQ